MNQVNFKNRGSISVLTLILMPVLIVSVGLALDMGKFFVVRSELQNAADACALAAAYELDGLTSVSFTNAENAGIELASQNNVLFQKNSVSTPTVQFSSTIDGGYKSAGSATPATDVYVRCTVSEANIPNWFLQLLPSFGNQTINATAVASNIPGQQTCALPIGVCEDSLIGKVAGDWVDGKQSAQGTTKNNNDPENFFHWIDFDPPAGGANELKALLSGANSCEVTTTSPNIGQFGNAQGAEMHYNSRFGILAGDVPSDAVPDFTGHAYYTTNWPTQKNAYVDYIQNQVPSHSAYQNPLSGITLVGNPTVLNSTALATRGQSRRIAVAPVIDCSNQAIKRWACVFLLHPFTTGGSGQGNFISYLEYLGDASSGGPCKTFDAPGGPSNAPLVSTLVQ